ncbi:MAG: hypothetical protein CVT47_00510 [Thermoplasmata archaeon HGW-Thermoplasmata-2]|nr:MAG: hypothetical protein CVT47_00510 [Thermoplasmata archaeon HGW-Thermoplasmata-2]
MTRINFKEGITLACIQPEKYVDTVFSVMEGLKDEKGVYINASRPYEVFSPLLEKKGINTENIFFIDCISNIVGIPAQAKNVRYIPTPTMLELITIYLENALKENPGFVILDSISALTIYNSERAMLEFLHFIVSRMRQKNVKTILLDTDSHIPQSMCMLCDEVVRL